MWQTKMDAEIEIKGASDKAEHYNTKYKSYRMWKKLIKFNLEIYQWCVHFWEPLCLPFLMFTI